MASLIGIDIGMNNCKIALHDGRGYRLVSSRMPENMIDTGHKIAAPEALANFLSDLRKSERIRDKNCILILAESEVFFRHVTLPKMSAEEVELNLPYEFRDFITGDPSEYNYDYLVDELPVDENGNVTQLELFAAATEKKRVDTYAEIMRKAGMRLKAVIPAQLAYSRLITNYAENVEPDHHERDLILVDIGHDEVVVSLLHGSHFEASRVIDFGCNEFDNAIADIKGIDPYTAGSYKYTNFEGVLDTPECMSVCDRLSVEINKVINFYNFNNPDMTIEQMYFMGGGAQIPQLTSTISDAAAIPASSIVELLPQEAQSDPNCPVCALAIGGCFEGEAM